MGTQIFPKFVSHLKNSRCLEGNVKQCMMSGFRCEVAENCALLGYYAASSDNFLPMFWYNLSMPSSGFKNPEESL